MNDLARDKLRQANGGNLPYWAEMVAGGCGGASQVLILSPSLSLSLSLSPSLSLSLSLRCHFSSNVGRGNKQGTRSRSV